MEKRSRLGRGLSSLLNSSSVEVEPPSNLPIHLEISHTEESARQTPAAPGGAELLHMELSKIQANPTQPRKRFDEAGITTLAESVKVAGIIQPIVVRLVGDHYEVIAGERRWRAAKLAGLLTIPVIVRQVNAAEQSQLALIENIHREDLNPIERAMAYRDMVRQLSLTQAELATKLGEERSRIGHYLRLLDLPEKTRELVTAGRLSLGHAKLLTALEDPNEIDRLAELVVTQSLSVRQLEKLIKEGVPAIKPPAATRLPTPHIADLERRISRDLQMRAEVKQAAKGGKGRLVLHYASLDQFDEVLNRLGIKVDD